MPLLGFWGKCKAEYVEWAPSEGARSWWCGAWSRRDKDLLGESKESWSVAVVVGR